VSNAQKELLAKMRTGRRVTIYNDDPRTVLHSADRHPAGGERVKNWKTVVALLNAGAVRVTSHSDDHTTYEAIES
jgi:hypothetical protein